MTHEELYEKVKDLIARPWTATPEEMDRDRQRFLADMKAHNTVAYIKELETYRSDECTDINYSPSGAKEEIYDFVASRKYDEVIEELKRIQHEAFWCGAFNFSTLSIVESHTYSECERLDFNSYWAFSDYVQQKFASGDLTFFYLNKGKIEIEEETIPRQFENIDMNKNLIYEFLTKVISDYVDIIDDTKALDKTLTKGNCKRIQRYATAVNA